MGDQRLQKCDQLYRLVLVRFGQVDFLQNEDLFGTIGRFESFSIGSGDFLTGLIKFFDEM